MEDTRRWEGTLRRGLELSRHPRTRSENLGASPRPIPSAWSSGARMPPMSTQLGFIHSVVTRHLVGPALSRHIPPNHVSAAVSRWTPLFSAKLKLSCWSEVGGGPCLKLSAWPPLISSPLYPCHPHETSPGSEAKTQPPCLTQHPQPPASGVMLHTDH